MPRLHLDSCVDDILSGGWGRVQSNGDDHPTGIVVP
jgi:hypothetical protein